MLPLYTICKLVLKHQKNREYTIQSPKAFSLRVVGQRLKIINKNEDKQIRKFKNRHLVTFPHYTGIDSTVEVKGAFSLW